MRAQVKQGPMNLKVTLPGWGNDQDVLAHDGAHRVDVLVQLSVSEGLPVDDPGGRCIWGSLVAATDAWRCPGAGAGVRHRRNPIRTTPSLSPSLMRESETG